MAIRYRSGVVFGDGNHAAEQLSRAAARRHFKQGRLAIEISFRDLGEGNLVSPQKIFSLHAGQPQHLRNLVKSQGVLAIALQGERFEGAARHVATVGGKPLRDIIGNVKSHFHTSKFNTHLPDYPTFPPLVFLDRFVMSPPSF